MRKTIKKIIIISIVIIALMYIIAIVAKIMAIYIETSKVLEFEITEQEYNYYKNERSLLEEEKVVGSVKNIKDAKKQAEIIFSEYFGEKEAKQKKPYIVSYDKKRKIWYVVGKSKTFLPGFAVLGRSLNLLITEEGQVLSVWR